MWTWKQSSGKLTDAKGNVVGSGYAGKGVGLNNAGMQNVPLTGPLPRGKYKIGPLLPSHGALGTNVAALTPDPTNEMFGRNSFFLHGRKSPTDMDASEGCIVMDHDQRMAVLLSADRDLEVLE